MQLPLITWKTNLRKLKFKKLHAIVILFFNMQVNDSFPKILSKENTVFAYLHNILKNPSPISEINRKKIQLFKQTFVNFHKKKFCLGY